MSVLGRYTQAGTSLSSVVFWRLQPHYFHSQLLTNHDMISFAQKMTVLIKSYLFPKNDLKNVYFKGDHEGTHCRRKNDKNCEFFDKPIIVTKFVCY